MKNMISSIVSIKLQFVFAVLMMLFSGNILFAQNKNNTQNIQEENLSTSYNTPFSYILENETPWSLKNAQGQIINKGIGSIENQVFTEPGNYTLQIAATPHNNSCEHDHSPKNLTINVSQQRMVFDLSSVKFSQNIIGGQSAKNSTVTVKVDYSSYDNTSTVYKQSFATSGVGTSVSGKLKNGEVTLKQGINTLEFVLDGQASKGTYITLDFIDINGKVQPYGLTQKIQ